MGIRTALEHPLTQCSSSHINVLVVSTPHRENGLAIIVSSCTIIKEQEWDKKPQFLLPLFLFTLSFGFSLKN
jgi:hypothetical protein